MTQTYAETLKQRRKAQGITIVELSDKTGISQMDLVKAERGNKPLSEELIRKASVFLK